MSGKAFQVKTTFNMPQVAFSYYLCLFETRVILTRSDGGECESMGKQRIMKFQVVEALYILRYNRIQDSCADSLCFELKSGFL